jgi:hypothetical protein
VVVVVLMSTMEGKGLATDSGGGGGERVDERVPLTCVELWRRGEESTMCLLVVKTRVVLPDLLDVPWEMPRLSGVIIGSFGILRHWSQRPWLRIRSWWLAQSPCAAKGLRMGLVISKTFNLRSLVVGAACISNALEVVKPAACTEPND